jgi:hypothetical protein
MHFISAAVILVQPTQLIVYQTVFVITWVGVIELLVII